MIDRAANAEDLHHLLTQVAAGTLSVEHAQQRLMAYEDLGFAKVDYQRADRQGFPEVVWGLGKSAGQIAEILDKLQAQHPIALATRIEPSSFVEIAQRLPLAHYYPLARICAVGKPEPKPGRITLVTAGTTDIPVAEEAAVTAELCGFQVTRLWDVGVSGLHRLLDNRQCLLEAEVLIVAAGMEGALPSVVGGLVSVPVIAVPTSVGYGASFGGVAALLSMLNSCASGLAVVNIDNGFGAAMLAARILNRRSG
ncbi:nickel pincer cofactor biosynthesis protein LarB [Anthocerotibacter panamensis]|uniref:nickel pincer cofactor biosynthesis protein LarB n=1 Tax=Anthocerotibacter panamensis TaxID=2857077 RepID=UPI001FD88D92|nr:nickel pincer cofactor biosynthesis protein LarB [Anthocerotibacter panamensis]